MNWTSSGLTVDEIPADEPFGFIYRITYTDGTYYYGRKNFYNYMTLSALKSGNPREGHIRFKGKNKNGKRIQVEEIKRESDWKEYEGSSENTSELEIASKEILAFARTNRELGYLEPKCLFQMEALEDPLCHNDQINRMWWRGKLIQG